ncbi:MAG: PAS domain S-box protein [Caldilineaceae bacterium]
MSSVDTIAPSTASPQNSPDEEGGIFAQIVKNNPLPIALVVPETGELIDVNIAGCKLTGYTHSELLGKKGHELGIWPNVQQWRNIRAELTGGGGSCTRELTLRTRSGADIDVLASFEMLERNGAPCMLIILNDITERKRMELALHERTAALSEHVKELQCLFWITNLLQTRSAETRQVLQTVSEQIPLGWWKPEETWARITYNDIQYTDESTPADMTPNMTQTITVGADAVGRIEIFTDESEASSPFRGDKQILLATIARLLGDYLERERAGDALSESRRRYEQLIQNAPLGIVVFDRNGHVTITNSTAQSLLQLSGNTALSSIHDPFFVQTQLSSVISECIEKRQHNVVEVSYNRGHDDFGRLRVHLTPICQEDGVLASVQAMFEDVTQHRESERQQNHRQKLEAVGELAAGIAHEINTPIQFIGDNIHFLQDAFQDLMRLLDFYHRSVYELAPSADHPSVHALEQLITDLDLQYLVEEIPNAIIHSLDGVARVADIVSAMRTFAHPATDVKVPVDINQALTNTLTVTRNEYKYIANAEVDFDASLPLVPCDPGEINQVFLNIIVNAAYAIAEKGPLSAEQDRGLITLRTRRQGNEAMIAIEDTGVGIAQEDINRVFDPFFTTKPVGKGTGQGLSIVHSIVVQKHQGRIELESVKGKGTTFMIYLPLEDAQNHTAKV